jgi:lipid-binding SYLF domain-containing protein
MSKIRSCVLALCLLVATTVEPVQVAIAASANELNTDGKAALDRLLARSDKARRYSRDARAILVFPRIVKAGLLMVGGQSGEGVLFVDGQPSGYFRISAASFGMQAGGQTFGYALFLMNDGAVSYLREHDGWAIGSGPSVVVVDEGAARATNTTTLREDIVAMAFDQRGLMAGLGLEGSKITPIEK